MVGPQLLSTNQGGRVGGGVSGGVGGGVGGPWSGSAWSARVQGSSRNRTHSSSFIMITDSICPILMFVFVCHTLAFVIHLFVFVCHTFLFVFRAFVFLHQFVYIHLGLPWLHPILDTRISVFRPPPSEMLRLTPLESETGWTGELWSKTYLLNWQN